MSFRDEIWTGIPPRGMNRSFNIYSIEEGGEESNTCSVIPPTFARATVMVTLLAAEVGLEESFGTLRVTLARRQLPTTGTGHALIPSGPGTRFARQIAFRALAPIAVIPGLGTSWKVLLLPEIIIGILFLKVERTRSLCPSRAIVTIRFSRGKKDF